MADPKTDPKAKKAYTPPAIVFESDLEVKAGSCPRPHGEDELDFLFPE